MQKQTTGLHTVFLLLLVVTAAGIVVHYLTGYHYPATPAFNFEINVLGDPYELFFVVPLGLAALWLLRKGNAWGSLLVAFVATHFFYNYAMFVTGRQNPWIFVWIAKLALSGVVVCLLWNELPAHSDATSRVSRAIAIYLALVLLVFSKMMSARLLASATGSAVDMTMQGAGVLDWGEPFLRDPVIFFAFACPLIVTAIIGLWRKTQWGMRAAALATAFIVSIVTVALFTGPLKEYLMQGMVSPAMWGMSVIMVLAAAPAVGALVWLARGAGSPGTQLDADQSRSA